MSKASQSKGRTTPITAAAVERTTTAEALLGVLGMRAMTGYEVRQTIEASIGEFWSESFGQIYPTLKQLVKDGLAEPVDEPPRTGTRAGRKAYRLTAAGQKRLKTWLATPSAEQVPRNEMLLKIFFAGRLGPDAAISQVTSYRQTLAARLARFGEIRMLFETEYARFADAPYWRMTLEYGIAKDEGLLRWSESTLETLNQMGEVRDAS